MAIPQKFELWHSIATLVALNMCIAITKAPFTDYENHTSSFDMLLSTWWRPILFILGCAGCFYLIRELYRQVLLLLKSKREKA